MGGLRERPLTENGGGFQSGPSVKNEEDFGTKNNKKKKETYIFLKGGSFGAAQVGKVEQTNVYIFEKGGGGCLSERSRSKKWSL